MTYIVCWYSVYSYVCLFVCTLHIHTSIDVIFSYIFVIGSFIHRVIHCLFVQCLFVCTLRIHTFIDVMFSCIFITWSFIHRVIFFFIVCLCIVYSCVHYISIHPCIHKRNSFIYICCLLKLHCILV